MHHPIPARPSGLKQDALGLYLDGQLPDGSYRRIAVEDTAQTLGKLNVFSITDHAITDLSGEVSANV